MRGGVHWKPFLGNCFFLLITPIKNRLPESGRRFDEKELI